MSKAPFKFILGDGYPFPYPSNPDDQEQANEDAPNHRLELKGVAGFEWRFTVTIQFVDYAAFKAAQELTGWDVWCEGDLLLEAKTSRGDGREFPAIVVNDRAYCQIFIESE